MTERMKLVLASNNAKKLGELQTLLGGLPLELVSQRDLGIREAEEPHHTFLENALAKARHAAAASGCAAIADDSGLCVDALGGAPGVGSAHYADVGPMTLEREAHRRLQDGANNELLIERLQGVSNRRGMFVCTLVAIRHADDPQPLVAVGRWPGTILPSLKGTQGFGYDPLLYVTELGRTVAELDAATKNAHSHRARAMTQMRALLQEAWALS